MSLNTEKLENLPPRRAVEAYVLPSVGSYAAYVDVDIDEYARDHGETRKELMIEVYSPEELSAGELAEIPETLTEEWSRYICRREFSRDTFRWLKWMALLEGVIAVGLVVSDFLPIYPTSRFYMFYSAAIDLFFWGALIFGPVTVAGVRVLKNRGREIRARALLENWTGTCACEGSDPDRAGMVKELNAYFSRLDGREIDLYRKMRDHCERQGFLGPAKFYRFKVEDLEKEESFHLKYHPTSLKKKIRNLFLGPKVESPKIVVPMRNMETTDLREGQG